MTLYFNKVWKGVEFLDVTYGPDWPWEIDLSILNLDHTTHCLLGQLTKPKLWEPDIAGYHLVARRLSKQFKSDAEARDWAVDRGFAADGLYVEYQELTATWLSAIEQLRAERPQVSFLRRVIRKLYRTIAFWR